MRWLLLGAVLAVLLLYPAAFAVVVTVVTAVLAKPVMIAFGLGLFVRPYLRRPGWAR